MDYSDFAPTLLVTEDGPVRILTMNRPDDLNSFDDDLHRGMRRIWDALIDDDDARAVVLTGAGRAFSTGGYLPNFVLNTKDPVHRRRDVREAERLAKAMLECELPVVAAVNGPAVGLGCTLAVMCDIVVMADDTFMSDPHVSVGLVAGDGGPLTWPFMMSMLRAKEYIFLGERIYATDAERFGLANRLTPKDKVLSDAIGLAHRLSAQPVQALRDTKRAMNLHLLNAANMLLPFALSTESESFLSDDVRVKVEAFLAK
jgi:enoyl-CoA hydratase